MIGTLKQRHKEYLFGYHLKKDSDVLTKVLFKYSIVSEQEKTYSKPIRNLVTSRNSYIIQTTFDLDLSVGDYIFTDRELNNKFVVGGYVRVNNKINESSLGTTKRNNNTILVMELK